MRVYILFVFFTGFFFTGIDANNTGCSLLLKKGGTALEENKPDSALYYYYKAYKQGMPQDSFYYYLGKTYIKKGALDSALALNYAVKADKKSALGRKILVQRKKIYSALGWNEKAGKINDTIEGLKSTGEKLIPDLTLRSALGYKEEARWIDTNSIWGTVDPDGQQKYKGPFISADMDVSWDLPDIGKCTPYLGLKAGFDKPYYTTKDESKDQTLPEDSDITNVSGGITGGLENMFNIFTLNYSGRVKRYYNGDFAFNLSSDLSYIYIGDKSVHAYAAGYELQKGEESYYDKQIVWMMGSWNLLPQNKGNLTFQLFGNGYFAGPMEITYYPEIQYMDNIIGLYNEMQEEIFLTLNYDVSYFNIEMPVSFYSASPSCEYSYSLPADLNMGLEVKYQFDYYPEYFVWKKRSKTSEDFLVYNRTEGQYYTVDTRGEVNPDWVVQDSEGRFVLNPDYTNELTAAGKNTTRIDNKIGLTLFFKKKFDNAGSFRIKGGGIYTLTNCAENSPLDIPAWSWSVGLNWRKEFSFEQ